jgi:hypothetical protein
LSLWLYKSPRERGTLQARPGNVPDKEPVAAVAALGHPAETRQVAASTKAGATMAADSIPEMGLAMLEYNVANVESLATKPRIAELCKVCWSVRKGSACQYSESIVL